MYKLVPIVEETEVAKLEQDDLDEHFVEGEIDGRVIIKVTTDMSYATVYELQKLYENESGKPVSVFTDNIEFFKAVKLSPKEAAKVAKWGEELG